MGLREKIPVDIDEVGVAVVELTPEELVEAMVEASLWQRGRVLVGEEDE